MNRDTPDNAIAAAAASMEMPTKRRRKTNTPSTMTTPEREQQSHSHAMPVRNPRISAAIAASPPRDPRAPPTQSVPEAPFPQNYRSQNFMSLLDSDDDDADEDVDVFNKHTHTHTRTTNSNHNHNTSSNVLQTVKGSSPDSDSNDDDESQSSVASNNHSDSGEDEDDNSESDDDDHGFAQTQTQTRIQHQHHRAQQKPSFRYSTKIAASPSHVLAAAATGSGSGRTVSVGAPSIESRRPRKPITKRLLSQPYVSATVKPTQSPPPPRVMRTRTSSTVPPPQPPIHRRVHDDNTFTTVHVQESSHGWLSRLKHAYLHQYARVIHFCLAIRDMILWLPRKLYRAVQFLHRHWLPLLLVLLLSVLCISPISQLWEVSHDNMPFWSRLPHYLRLRPSIVYCDSDDDADDRMETMTLHYDCEPCPDDAVCANGEFLFCKGDNKKLIRGQCKYDPLQLKQVMQQMQRKSATILAQRAGQFECQQFGFYNLVYDVHAPFAVNSRAMPATELALELAKLMRFDYQSHFFKSAFEKFKTSVHDMPLLYRDDIVFVENDDGGVFYSPHTHRPIGCVLCVLLQTHCVAITMTSVVSLVVLYVWLKRKRKRARRLRQKQLIEDRKQHVIAILDEYQKHSHNKWIPVLVVQERVMGSTHESAEWKKVEKEVDRDAKVVKSSQMIDGLQKLCWKLSETALIGGVN